MKARVLAEMQLRTTTTSFSIEASWLLSRVSGLSSTQRHQFQTETPFRRCAELDFGFPSRASLVVTYICYPELKLSTHAAGLVAQYLSCKTLPAELGDFELRWKWSLEDLLPTLSLRQPRAAYVLSGVSSNRLTLSQANRTAPNQKPCLEEVLSLTLVASPVHPGVPRTCYTP